MNKRPAWPTLRRASRESDDELIAKVRHGDTSGFDELYRRHRPAAEATARWLLRSRGEVDDIVSDAFAGVLAAIRNGNGPRDNFRSYLLAAVRNGCRYRGRRLVTADLPESEARDPMFEDPERYVEADTVARAFASLNPRWQQTLWLTEVEQRPPSEVAARMDLAPNATAALTLRAREAFATAYLAEHVSGSPDDVCERYGRRLAAYVRGQLTDRQRDEIEHHLIECSRCQLAVDELSDVNASLRKLLPPIAPALTAPWTVGTLGTMSNLFSSGLLLKGATALLIAVPLLVIISGPGRGGAPDDEDVNVVVAAPNEPGPEFEPVVTHPLPSERGGARAGVQATSTTIAPVDVPAPAEPTTPYVVIRPIVERPSEEREPDLQLVPEGVVTPIIAGVVGPVVDNVVAPVVEDIVVPIAGDFVVPVVEDVVVPVVEDAVIPLVENVAVPVVDGAVLPVVDEVVVPVVDEVVVPVVGEVAVPVVDEVVVPIFADVVVPVVDEVVVPIVDEVVVPIVDEVVVPVVDEVVVPVVDEVVVPVVDEVVVPVVDEVVVPMVDEVVVPVVDEVVVPIVDEVVVPVVEDVVEPVVVPVVEDVVEPVVGPVLEDVVEPVVVPVVEDVVEPVVVPVVEDVVEPVVEPVVEDVVEPVVEPIVEVLPPIVVPTTWVAEPVATVTVPDLTAPAVTLPTDTAAPDAAIPPTEPVLTTSTSIAPATTAAPTSLRR